MTVKKNRSPEASPACTSTAREPSLLIYPTQYLAELAHPHKSSPMLCQDNSTHIVNTLEDTFRGTTGQLRSACLWRIIGGPSPHQDTGMCCVAQGHTHNAMKLETVVPLKANDHADFAKGYLGPGPHGKLCLLLYDSVLSIVRKPTLKGDFAEMPN